MNNLPKTCEKCKSPRKFDIPPLCEGCYDLYQREKFEQFPIVEWDKKTPLCVYNTDQYLMDEDSASDYVFENPDAMIVVCRPIFLRLVQSEYWEDDLPEDGELPNTIIQALEKLNITIMDTNTDGPASWTPSNKRIDNKAEFPEIFND